MLYNVDYYGFTEIVDILGSNNDILTKSDLQSWMYMNQAFNDQEIDYLIATAIDFFEKRTNFDVIKKRKANYLDNFSNIQYLYYDCQSRLSNGFLLKETNISEVESVGYYNKDGNFITIDSAKYLFKIIPNEGTLVYYNSSPGYFPSDYRVTYNQVSQDKTVRTQFICGFDADKIPQDIKHCIRLLATFLHENRGDCNCEEAKDPIIWEVINRYNTGFSFVV